jgi:iron complex transport system substrate-binding protein
MSRSLRALSVLVLLPVLFLAACGDSDEDAAEDTDPTPAAVADSVDISKDDLGRSVTAPANPQRVVAMSPTVVELLYSVGVTPVGRPSSATFPEAAKSVPDFGTSYQPSYEAIVAMKPDLIIADALIQAATIEDLAKLGAPVFAVEVDSYDSVVRGTKVVGALTGKKEAADTAVTALETKFGEIKKKIPATGNPNVLIVVGAGPTQVFAARSDSYVGSLVESLGAKNVAATEPASFRLPGFGEYSLEKIVAANPDVIIAISPGQPNVTTQALSRSPIWSSLKAVQTGQVHEVSPQVYIESAGPRVSLILDELPRLLYPSVFSTAR